MLLKILNALLLIATIIGGIYTYQASRKHQQLLTIFERLESTVGDIDIDDPSKVYVKALPTGEDLHFAWRIYLPAGFQAHWQHNSGSSSSTVSNPCEFISRVRFTEDSEGILRVYSKKYSGSSCMSLEGRKLADLLRGRWNEIHVEQLGSDSIATVEPDEVVVMLRLTLSDELKREIERKLPKYSSKRLQAEFFGLRFGSKSAYKKAGISIP